MNNKKRFAIVLSGCGRADGSEIHEAVSLLLATDMNDVNYEFFAPDISQKRVLNHLSGKIENEQRSVLVESARIARGNIKPLNEYNPENFDAIVFPGGVGAVTNLCNFALTNHDYQVDSDVKKALEKSYAKKIVIGAMCIAPVLVAGVLGKYGVVVSIGNDKNTIAKIESFGAKHRTTSATEVCVDKEHKIVTTPAYMLANSPKEVYQGACEMVKEIIKLADL